MKNILVALLVLLPGISSAVSVCKNCTISGMQPDPRRNGTYIWFEGNWSDSETSCNTPSSKAFFVPAGSNVEGSLISISLAAMISGKTIGYVYGNGVCSQGYEILNYFYLSK